MVAEMVHYSVWNIPYCVKKAKCEDGKRRYARITGQADTWFSIPAQVKVYVAGECKTVSGRITGSEVEIDGEWVKDYNFIASSYGKNGQLLKGESK